MKAPYLPFYVDGREAKVIRASADDLVDDIVKRINAGGDLWPTVHEVCADAAKAFTADRGKRQQFLRDNEDEIKEAGGDETAAWEHFCAGKVDELAESIEPVVVEALIESVNEDDEDDEEEDDDAEDPEDAE